MTSADVTSTESMLLLANDFFTNFESVVTIALMIKIGHLRFPDDLAPVNRAWLNLVAHFKEHYSIAAVIKEISHKAILNA